MVLDDLLWSWAGGYIQRFNFSVLCPLTVFMLVPAWNLKTVQPVWRRRNHLHQYYPLAVRTDAKKVHRWRMIAGTLLLCVWLQPERAGGDEGRARRVVLEGTSPGCASRPGDSVSPAPGQGDGWRRIAAAAFIKAKSGSLIYYCVNMLWRRRGYMAFGHERQPRRYQAIPVNNAQDSPWRLPELLCSCLPSNFQTSSCEA